MNLVHMRIRPNATGICLLIVVAIAVRLVVTGESALYATGDLHTLLIVSIPVLFAAALASMVSREVDDGHQHGSRLALVSLGLPVAIAALGVGPIMSNVDPPEPESGVEQAEFKIPAQWADPQAQPDDDADAMTTRNTPVGPPPDGEWPVVSDGDDVDVYAISARMDQDAADTIVGKRVTTIGYISADPDRPGGPAMVVRMKIWCCAADGLPFAVSLIDAPDLPDPGEWVEVSGTVLPPASNGDAAMSVDEVSPVDQPKRVYLE